MFEFIRNLFKKEPVGKKVKLEELEDWLDEETKDRLETLKAEIKTIFLKIEGERNEIRKNLGILEKAELQNKNISVKEKQLMEGNRFSYIKKMNSFLEETSAKEKKRVLDFCQEFDEALERLNKSTAKPYYVVREFFSQYASEIAQNIRDLNNSVKALKETMEKNNVALIEETKKDISRMKNKLNLKEDIEKQIKELEEQANEIGKSKEVAEHKIEEIKNSNEFLELNKLKGNLNEINERMKKAREIFLHDFYVIGPALKKYGRMTLDEATVNSYLENPLKAIKKDSELKIVEILGKLKENIFKNTIDLKDKKREKIVKTIDFLDEEYFKDFFLDYENLIDEKSNVEKAIESKTVNRILNELNLDLVNLNEKIKRVQDKISYLNKEKEKEDVDKIKKAIKENLKEITDFEVEVI